MLKQQAMQCHYDKGPSKNRAKNHVSGYAMRHSWEVLVETANDLGGRNLDMPPVVIVNKLVTSILNIVVGSVHEE